MFTLIARIFEIEDLERVRQKHVLDAIGDGNGLAVRIRGKTRV